MRPHHTKNKGDLGILHALLDLAKKGFGVLAPMTEHEAFDLVAYKDDRFLRVQVKFRAAVRGVILAPFTTCWADRHGVHSRVVDKAAVDVFCIYCPDTDRCYYVDPRQFGRMVVLRIAPPRSSQKKRLHWASDYLEIPASVRGVQAGVTNRT
jgi:hypothetical protein